MAALIERLNARAHDPKRATDERQDIRDEKRKPVVFGAAPPLTEEQAARVEDRLGFPLPDLLRRVYTEVGNGGFGPGYGLLALATAAGDAGNEQDSVVGHYALLRQAQSSPPWPRGLILICEWGCGIASYLDCSRPAVPVIRFDPNMPVQDVAERVPVGLRYDRADQVGDVACWVEYPSLQEWLEAWVEGTALFYAAYGESTEGEEDYDEDEEAFDDDDAV